MPDNRTLNSRYTLVGEIGRGGMGVVYRAEDAQMRRVVAIKTLPSIMTHNQELMRRFNSEIQHASQLEHPNIARVYDVGEDAGTNYYVMQYIDGKSLRELLKEKGRLTLEEALPILEQVASALDYANSQGIVHRDIKPENILLNKTGNAYVVDFGIAKAAEGTRTTRGMLGTPEYMSPEQIRGEVVDGRSDQYSLAVVAYEMLTGQTPFKTEGDDPWAQIQKHLNEKVPYPKSIEPSLSIVVSNALLKGLMKETCHRFNCTKLFIDELSSINIRYPDIKRSLLSSRYIISMLLVIFFIASYLYIYSKNINNIVLYSKKQIKTQQQSKEMIVFLEDGAKMDSVIASNYAGDYQYRVTFIPKYSIIKMSNVLNLIEYRDFECEDHGLINCLTKHSITKKNTYLEVYSIFSDGKTMVGEVNDNDKLTLLNTKDYGVIKCITEENEKFASPVCNIKGDKLAFISEIFGHYHIVIYDIKVNKIIRRIPFKPCTIITFENDILGIISYNSLNKVATVSKVNLNGDEKEIYKLSSSEFGSYDLSKNEKFLLHTTIDNKIKLVDIENGKEKILTNSLDNTVNIQTATFNSACNKVLYSLCSGNSLDTVQWRVYVYDIITGKTNQIGLGYQAKWLQCPTTLLTNIVRKDDESLTNNVPKGYKITQQINANFNENVNIEQLYLAQKDNSSSSSIFWIEDNGKKIWETSDSIYHIYISDVTGDDRPDIITVSELEGSGCYWNCNIYSNINNRIKNIESFNDMTSRSGVELFINENDRTIITTKTVDSIGYGGDPETSRFIFTGNKWNGVAFVPVWMKTSKKKYSDGVSAIKEFITTTRLIHIKP